MTQVFVAIDLATTGLDPETCEIIGIACVVLATADDGSIHQIDAFDSLVIPQAITTDRDGNRYVPANAEKGALAFHENEGLIDLLDVFMRERVHQIEQFQIHQIEQYCIRTLRSIGEKIARDHDEFLLVGKNTQFDAAFMFRHMPNLLCLFEQRNLIDVATLREVFAGAIGCNSRALRERHSTKSKIFTEDVKSTAAEFVEYYNTIRRGVFAVIETKPFAEPRDLDPPRSVNVYTGREFIDDDLPF